MRQEQLGATRAWALVVGVPLGLVALGAAVSEYSPPRLTKPPPARAAAGRTQQKVPECGELEALTVRGRSMGQLLPAGTQVRLYRGSLACQPVMRDDLVALNIPGRATLAVKRAAAVPGDRVSLHKDKGGWRLVINGQVATTSTQKPFFLAPEERRLLGLYIKDSPFVLEDATYLLLGDRVSGSHDSRRFGLVAQQDLVGHILPVSHAPRP